MNYNIGYVFDEGFAECAAVSMISIMKNNQMADAINFWILDDGITQKSKERLVSMVEQNGGKIHFADGAKLADRFRKLEVEPWRGRYSAYMKLFVSEFELPVDVERFLVIDGDTVVVNSIQELFCMDLENHPCAMGLECIPGDYYFISGLGKHELYNAGVILYDVKKWKEMQVENEVIRYIKENGGRYMLPEEDIISRILMDNVKILQPEFNYLTLFDIYNTRKYFKRLLWDELEGYVNNWNELIVARENVKIYHCISTCSNRPWHKNNIHPYTSIYDNYRKDTPWNDDDKIVCKMSLWHKIMFQIRKILPRRLSNYYFYLSNKYSFSAVARKYYQK